MGGPGTTPGWRGLALRARCPRARPWGAAPEVPSELDPAGLVASIRTPEWKLVSYPGVDGRILQLFDLVADPGETRDVAARAPEVRESLGRRLGAWQSSGDLRRSAPVPELDPEQAEALRALGYLD